jgi:hypothetical protein
MVRKTPREENMPDNNEKILPVMRWLLAAFLGLLLMLALQLAFVVSGANATTVDIHLTGC